MPRTFLILICLLSAWPCAAGEPRFVRGGIVWEGGNGKAVVESGGREIPFGLTSLGAHQALLAFDWLPETGYTASIGAQKVTLRSPRKPAPLVVAKIPLEDVSQAASAGIAPDACVRFSPDNRHLAIGSYGGWLRIVEARSGEIVYRQRIPEGMAKRLAWSPDGARLYVGEQSPDANLFAIDTSDHFRRAWTLRLADVLETSRPAADDSYGRYSLPAVYDLQVADDGRIFAAGVHSWRVQEGDQTRARNRSQILAVDPEGKVLWRFPQKPAPVNVVSFGMDTAGKRLAAFVHQTQRREEGQELDSGTLYAIDGQTGQRIAAERISPDPHFERAESWDSVAVSPAGDRVALGLQDGRAMLFGLDADKFARRSQFDLGRAVQVGNIPIAAAASYARIFGDRLYLQTQNTHIPLASAQAAQQPPSMHRGANMLSVCDLEGKKKWLYRGPFSLSGSWVDRSSPGGRWLLVTCRELPGAAEPGQYGALVFDLAREGSGSERLVYYYPTEGPVFAVADISPDGRLIAVVEIPALRAGGRDLFGAHQVHVVH
jgi:WD40 repeat protein